MIGWPHKPEQEALCHTVVLARSILLDLCFTGEDLSGADYGDIAAVGAGELVEDHQSAVVGQEPAESVE